MNVNAARHNIFWVLIISSWFFSDAFYADLTTVGNKKYFTPGHTTSWSKARESCEYLGLELASVMSLEEQTSLTDYLIQRFHGNMLLWLDGTDSHTEDKWIWAKSSKQINFTAWYDGEPNNVDDEDCLAIQIKAGNNWLDLSCSATYLYYLCQAKIIKDKRNMPSKIENKTESISLQMFNGYEYYFHESEPWKTWNESNDYCNQLGMNLATITDGETTDYILTFINFNLTRKTGGRPGENIDFWLGARKNGREMDWKWLNSSGENFYKPWGEGEIQTISGATCLEIRQRANLTRAFFGSSCFYKQSFICQRKIAEQEEEEVSTVENTTITPIVETNISQLNFTQKNGLLFFVLLLISIVMIFAMLIGFAVVYKRMQLQYYHFRANYCNILQKVDLQEDD